MKAFGLLMLLAGLPLLARCDAGLLVKGLTDELRATLQRRGVEEQYHDMTAFFANRLDESAGEKTFSDKTGNCRLSWFDWMLRHPIESIAAAEEFTRTLHATAGRPRGAVAGIVDIAAAKLDAPVPDGGLTVLAPPEGGDTAIAAVAWAVLLARRELDAALAPLTPAEREELETNLFEQSTGPGARAPFFTNKEKGRRVCDLLEKIDRVALMRAAHAVAVLTEPELLAELARTAARETQGKEMAIVETPAGKIVFGGPGANTYRLDEMPDVCAVIDVGGDDTYIEGTVSAQRPVQVIIDLGGNDTYRGEKPGIQGGAILGVSLLVDAAGDDVYTAGSVAQGACLAGVGILVDLAGNDRYTADRRVQG